MRKKPPSYRKHSSRDLAMCEYQGHRYYFPGKYNSRESRKAFRDFLEANYYNESGTVAPGPQSDSPWLVEVIVAYLEFASRRHASEGHSEYDNIKAAVSPLIEVFPDLRAADFGPRRLKDYQAHLVTTKNTRQYINWQINRVRRMFRWAVSEEMVPVSVYEALKTVEPIKKGETDAKESVPREPVPWEWIEPLFPFMPPTLQGMVRLQWFSGARSQNIVSLRPCDLNLEIRPVEWRPPKHKNVHRGINLLIFLGPRAYEAVRPFLDRDSNAFCFDPRESTTWRHDQRELERKSKRTPSQKRTGRVNRRVRSAYSVGSYRHAIQYVIDRCNKAREKQKLEPIPYWTPHQLRHARGTTIRADYGLEEAQAVLGHATMDATQIYAKQSLDRARRVALESG